MATKQGTGSWKKERATGRKYSGGDQDTQTGGGRAG